jgi:hypothetical protein
MFKKINLPEIKPDTQKIPGGTNSKGKKIFGIKITFPLWKGK